MPGVEELINDPEYQKLSPAGRQKAAAAIDPDFGKLSPSGYSAFEQRVQKPSDTGSPSALSRFGRGVYETTLGPFVAASNAMEAHPIERAISGPILPILHEAVKNAWQTGQKIFDPNSSALERSLAAVSMLPGGGMSADATRKALAGDMAGIAGNVTGLGLGALVGNRLARVAPDVAPPGAAEAGQVIRTTVPASPGEIVSWMAKQSQGGTGAPGLLRSGVGMVSPRAGYATQFIQGLNRLVRGSGTLPQEVQYYLKSVQEARQSGMPIPEPSPAVRAVVEKPFTFTAKGQRTPLYAKTEVAPAEPPPGFTPSTTPVPPEEQPIPANTSALAASRQARKNAQAGLIKTPTPPDVAGFAQRAIKSLQNNPLSPQESEVANGFAKSLSEEPASPQSPIAAPPTALPTPEVVPQPAAAPLADLVPPGATAPTVRTPIEVPLPRQQGYTLADIDAPLRGNYASTYAQSGARGVEAAYIKDVNIAARLLRERPDLTPDAVRAMPDAELSAEIVKTTPAPTSTGTAQRYDPLRTAGTRHGRTAADAKKAIADALAHLTGR